MKKLSLIVFTVFLGSVLGIAQVNKNDKAFTFYGLDFSKSKMIGSEGFSNPYDVVEKYFRSINELIRNEAEKYNIRAALNKDQIEYDYSIVEKNNAAVSPSELVINTSHSVSDNDVVSLIKGYKTKDSKLGVVFVVESFDKTAERANIIVTYFDPSTKQVLLTQRLNGKPGGFGFRNYWAGAIANILKEAKKQSKKW